MQSESALADVTAKQDLENDTAVADSSSALPSKPSERVTFEEEEPLTNSNL